MVYSKGVAVSRERRGLGWRRQCCALYSKGYRQRGMDGEGSAV